MFTIMSFFIKSFLANSSPFLMLSPSLAPYDVRDKIAPMFITSPASFSVVVLLPFRKYVPDMPITTMAINAITNFLLFIYCL
ncbi:MAG: hypothetical protein ACD_81C00010G0001 [uncultured bacterium]|nr:MAG: hypothetical protein ACD_81C00010G0001 [uncultured bacterium]